MVGYCREQAMIELVMGSESAGDRMSLNARQLLAYGKLIDIEQCRDSGGGYPQDTRSN